MEQNFFIKFLQIKKKSLTQKFLKSKADNVCVCVREGEGDSPSALSKIMQEIQISP